jgi:hypothetical protein
MTTCSFVANYKTYDHASVNPRKYVAMVTQNCVILELSSHRYIMYDRPIYIAILCTYIHTANLNSVVLVRKRTIPTERPQPVGEVSANFS